MKRRYECDECRQLRDQDDLVLLSAIFNEKGVIKKLCIGKCIFKFLSNLIILRKDLELMNENEPEE